MLPQSYRIKNGESASLLIRKGKRVYTKNFTLACLNNNSNQNRFFVVVSGKVSKKASERNLLKRRAREILRKNAPPKNVFGKDIAIIFSKSAAALNYKELEMEILEKLAAAKIL